jgi:RNA polymerase sigma-70 factor (ECF subfamily)
MILAEGVTVEDLPVFRSMQTAADWSESDLVAACRAGRKDGFEELARRHHAPLLRLAGVLVGRDWAEDVVQETLLAAVRALPAFRGDSKLSTWLISILRNQAFLARRSRRRWPAPLADEVERSRAAPEPDGRDERLAEIVARMRELPEDLRLPLVLFHLEGMPYAEIARAMDCPVGTVRSRLFEARDRIRNMMAPRGDA